MKTETTAPEPFRWTRSETLALANQHCVYCLGLGLRSGRSGKDTVCNCVLRAIFRWCHGKFRELASREQYVSRVSLEANPGRRQKTMYSRKGEEYMADFCLIARRTLPEDAHKIFRMHFLLGADWKACCRRLGIDRGTFFHDCYRIEEKLGRAFRETQPYSLFPTDEYFGGTRRSVGSDLDRVFPIEAEANPPGAKLLRFPVKREAAAA
ncbi:MAG: hypothetical protein ACRD19_15065 [Terriglobia bacterium]